MCKLQCGYNSSWANVSCRSVPPPVPTSFNFIIISDIIQNEKYGLAHYKSSSMLKWLLQRRRFLPPEIFSTCTFGALAATGIVPLSTSLSLSVSPKKLVVQLRCAFLNWWDRFCDTFQSRLNRKMQFFWVRLLKPIFVFASNYLWNFHLVSSLPLQ